MMSNLIQRLRDGAAPLDDPNLNDEAADTIERLTAELAAARETARRLMEAERVLQADAERYRWLAGMFEERRDGWWLDATKIDGAPSLETLDDAIDAAIGEGRC
jgi:hypothetical protein